MYEESILSPTCGCGVRKLEPCQATGTGKVDAGIVLVLITAVPVCGKNPVRKLGSRCAQSLLFACGMHYCTQYTYTVKKPTNRLRLRARDQTAIAV